MRKPDTVAKPIVREDELRHPGKTIALTESFGLLAMLRRGPYQFAERPVRTVRFCGFAARSAETAKAILDELGSALMFELDLAHGTAQELMRAQSHPQRPFARRSSSDQLPTFPRNAYDREPVALYMYGREALGMPLLQFLAYYQAVEFYFPRYAEADLRRRLEAIVKDPRFPHRDRDIGKLLGTVIGEGRRPFGAERDQLKATIRACLQPTEIREFVGSNENLAGFFADRRSSLTSCTIALRDETTDPRDAAATRIYDLRCKIVHTKDGAGENDLELLLPNSAEAQLLSADIGLLELIATRVIVASSRELHA